MYRLIAILTALLLAAPVAADSPNWFRTPNGTSTITVLRPPTDSDPTRLEHLAYFENDDATTDSVTIDTSRCGSVTFLFDPDEDGSNTGAEVYLHCADGHGAGTIDTQSRHVMPDTDGDGLGNDVTYTGTTNERSGIRFACPLTSVETSANAGTDEFRATLQCHR